MKKIYNVLVKSLTTLMIPLSSACSYLNGEYFNMKGGNPGPTPPSTSEANSQNHRFSAATFLERRIKEIFDQSRSLRHVSTKEEPTSNQSRIFNDISEWKMRSSVTFPTLASASSDSNDGMNDLNLYGANNPDKCYVIEVLFGENPEELDMYTISSILGYKSNLPKELLGGIDQRKYGMYFRGSGSDASECLRALGNSFGRLNSVMGEFLKALEMDSNEDIRPVKQHAASENIECSICFILGKIHLTLSLRLVKLVQIFIRATCITIAVFPSGEDVTIAVRFAVLICSLTLSRTASSKSRSSLKGT